MELNSSAIYAGIALCLSICFYNIGILAMCRLFGVGISKFSLGFSAGMSGSTGGIYIEADPSTMKNVPTGQHFYEIDIIQGSTILRLLEGRFEVLGNIRQ